jgi:hypothetical protein
MPKEYLQHATQNSFTIAQSLYVLVDTYCHSSHTLTALDLGYALPVCCTVLVSCSVSWIVLEAKFFPVSLQLVLHVLLLPAPVPPGDGYDCSRASWQSCRRSWAAHKAMLWAHFHVTCKLLLDQHALPLPLGDHAGLLLHTCLVC